ncbi:MAG: extracellular solute-binding protein [Propionibacteriaceae bacterium]|jgi:multiple sugar transport system substrate-binding protein|nr:extracellular solute-binding protein [Propionibacteriaceae bacterium]
MHRHHSFIPVVAAIGAALALSLAGCTGGGPSTGGNANSNSAGSELSGSITFQTWSLKNDKFTPYFENLVKDFQAKHPGTTINWVDQPGDGYEDKLQQQAGAGELPDVVNLSDSFAYSLAKAGKLVDLASADPTAIKLYVPGGLAGYTFAGLTGTWSYPWYLGTDLSWWNTAQLKEAGVTIPTTNDEFLADALKAAQDTNGTVRLISSMPDITVFEDAGVKTFDNGKFVFNTDKAVETLQKYVDLYKAGAMPPDALNNDYAGNSKLFSEGKVGFTTSTSSFVNELTTNAPTLLSEVDVTKRLATPPLFVQGLSVAKESKNPALALAFAQFATNDDNQTAFVKLAQGFLPGTVAANEDPSKFMDPSATDLMKKAVKLAAEEMKTAKPTSTLQYTDAMKQFVAQQLALAMQGQLTAKDALDKAVDFCNQNL